MTSPLVSFVTPTLGRPETHSGLYEGFAADVYEPKELVVLDESAEPSPFFTNLTDARVKYHHEPAGPRDGVTHIGRARNRICTLASGSIIEHRDDDDSYDPAYTTAMVQRLGGADLVKLVVWRSILSDGSVFEWDTRSMGGQHWALKGGETPEQVDIPQGGGDMALLLEAYRLGFGFSYVFRKSLWERFKFPDDGTEDYPWLRTCVENGAQVVYVADRPDLVLHTVHEKSDSMLWPQRKLERGTLGAMAGEHPVRAALRVQMLGAIGTMYPLPAGRAISVVPGATYHVIASVAKKHTMRAIVARASSWGVTITAARDDVPPTEVNAKAPPAGYRIIEVTGSASRATKMPWGVPKWLVFDKSTVLQAWSDRRPSAYQINPQLTPSLA